MSNTPVSFFFPPKYYKKGIILCPYHLQVNLKPRVPTKSVCAEHLELRKEILTLLNLQKQVSQMFILYI